MNGWLVLAVAAGGGAGSLVRFLVTRALPLGPGRLPLGVLVVNVAGSLLGGIVLGLVERAVLGDDARLVVLTGVAGGLTTFSTWSVETIDLIIQGRWRAGLITFFGTLLLGLAASVAGYLLTR